MKCRDCGAEIAHIGELQKHKKVCPALVDADLTEEEQELDAKIEEIMQEIPDAEPEPLEPAASVPCIIPGELIPEEIKYYAIGHTVGLRVTGRLLPNGEIDVQEVTLIR